MALVTEYYSEDGVVKKRRVDDGNPGLRDLLIAYKTAVAEGSTAIEAATTVAGVKSAILATRTAERAALRNLLKGIVELGDDE